MNQKVIGIIGGSGLYEMQGISNTHEAIISTPFGDPSDAYMVGEVGGVKMIFLPRHGRNHIYSPSTINYRANIWGMKKLGVTHILSVSACGSMREEIKPGEIVFIDQFFDRTRGRASTFFSDGIVGHVAFADPICLYLREYLIRAAKELGILHHVGGTYLCMEGPAFSTRAESAIYRNWGVSVIGMTNLTEAKLAREAEICYATLSLVTDYDCWRHHEEDVDINDILRIMAENVSNAKRIMASAALKIPVERKCKCQNASQFAVITKSHAIPAEMKKNLEIIMGKYWKESGNG